MAEWERRRHDLVRSLFEDMPRLSTIQESYEAESSKWFDEPPFLSPGSHSPLPDLIIERERNRHDEPEEFYQQLKTRMLKLYRKLYKNEHLDADSSEGEMEVTGAAGGSCFNDSRNDDMSEVESDPCSLATESGTFAQADLQDTSVEKECVGLPTYELITTRAVVHREEVSDEEEVLQESPIMFPKVRLVGRQATERDVTTGTRVASQTFSPVEVMREKKAESNSLGSITRPPRPGRVSSLIQLETDKEMSYPNNTPSDINIEEDINPGPPDDVAEITFPRGGDRSPHTDNPANTRKRKYGDCSNISEELPRERKKLKAGDQEDSSETNIATSSDDSSRAQVGSEKEMSSNTLSGNVTGEISSESPSGGASVISAIRGDPDTKTNNRKRKMSEDCSMSQELQHKTKKIKATAPDREDSRDYFENFNPDETLRRNIDLNSVSSTRQEAGSGGDSSHPNQHTERQTTSSRDRRSDNYVEEINHELSDNILNIALAHISPHMDASRESRRHQIADDSSGSSEILYQGEMFRNAEIQTNGHDEGIRCSDRPQTDLFHGTPMIFNLCRCTNHICE